jgi:hypothetical protein
MWPGNLRLEKTRSKTRTEPWQEKSTAVQAEVWQLSSVAVVWQQPAAAADQQLISSQQLSSSLTAVA